MTASQTAPETHPFIGRLQALGKPAALLLALLAGALSALGFEPVASISGPVLGLALFLLLLAAQPRGRAFLLGLGFGFPHFAVGLRWIAEAFTFQAAMPAWMGWMAVVGLSLFLSLYPALAALVSRRLATRLVPLTLIFAGLFVVTEILRGILFSGFAWNPLGVAWLQLPGVAQLAAVIGANGLSALAVLAGGSLAALVGARGERGRLGLLIVAPLLLLIGLGVPRLQKPLPTGPGPDLLLVQTGTGIADKYQAGGLEQSLVKAIQQTRAALAEGPPPAAVIWPEATVEFPMEEMPIVRQEVTRDFPAGTLLLTGGVGIIRSPDGEILAGTNSLYALDHRGAILTRYDKSHLVPGGEYLPLRWLAEPLGLARLVPGSIDFQPGSGATTWSLPGLPPLSPNICYEIIFPGAVVDGANRPAFLLTVSNDAWFGLSGPPQHHAQARLRAIEEGIPVVRVTPTGLSGLIDARGGLLQTLPQGKAATARVTVPPARAATPFAQLGLLAPLLLALLLVAGGLFIGLRKT